MAARVCEELAVLPLRVPVVLAAVLFRKAASTQWACAVSFVCALPLPPLLPLCSQVDYRGKVWVCNFCFSRNAVSCVGGGRRASEGVRLGLRVECRERGAGSQIVCVCGGGGGWQVLCVCVPAPAILCDHHGDVAEARCYIVTTGKQILTIRICNRISQSINSN